MSLPERATKASLVLLTSQEGQEKFKSALGRSDGSATIVVHPFFPEEGIGIDDSYPAYLENLTTAVNDARDSGSPIVFFERETHVSAMPEELNRLGVNDGEVFVIPTGDGTPEPTTTNLTELTHKLTEAGLQSTTVLGSYLWLDNPNYRKTEFQPTDEMPDYAHTNALHGCVGYTLEKFLEAGVLATPGNAVFPGTTNESTAAETSIKSMGTFINEPIPSMLIEKL